MNRFLLLLAVILLAVGISSGLEVGRSGGKRLGRGRLHQLCQRILNEDAQANQSLHTNHDRIRHQRQKTKCKYHMQRQEKCRRKYKQENGVIHSYHDNFYGWVVDVKCHRGYKFQGKSPISCYEDLTAEEKPHCIIQDCGQPKSRPNTTFIYNTTTYGSVLTVRCDEGYNLSTTPTSKCLPAGRWSKIAKCVLKKCPVIRNPSFGRKHVTRNSQGERTVMFECAPEYKLVGNASASCHYGTWTAPEPICMQIPDEKEDTNEVSENLLYGVLILGFMVICVIGLIIIKTIQKRRRHAAELSDVQKRNNADLMEIKGRNVDLDFSNLKREYTKGIRPSTSKVDEPPAYQNYLPRIIRDSMFSEREYELEETENLNVFMTKLSIETEQGTDDQKDLSVERNAVTEEFDNTPDRKVRQEQCEDNEKEATCVSLETDNKVPNLSNVGQEGFEDYLFGHEISDSEIALSGACKQEVNSTIDKHSPAVCGEAASGTNKIPLLAVCREATNKIPPPAICLVTPLRAGNEECESTNTQEGQEIVRRPEGDLSDLSADPSTLNWNKVFMFLIPRVCTDNWKLFAISLLGEALPNENINNVISRIENSSKTQPGGEKIEMILHSILQHWVSVCKSRCKSPSLLDIEKALDWSRHEDVIRDLKNNKGSFYTVPGEIQQDSSSKNSLLASVPELEYRIQPHTNCLTLMPCFEDQSVTSVPCPVTPMIATPMAEELTTSHYQYANKYEVHHQRARRLYRSKRQYSYPFFNNIRNKYKLPQRSKSFSCRLNSKPKSNRIVKKSGSTFVLKMTEKDLTCVNLIHRLLNIDPQKTLTALEHQMFMKHLVYKIQNMMHTNREPVELLNLKLDDYSICEHVPTLQNGSLHIINIGEMKVILFEEEWKMLETYVKRVRADVTGRFPTDDVSYLFLTYNGNQVTIEYLRASDSEIIKSTDKRGSADSNNICSTSGTSDDKKKAMKKKEVCDMQMFDFKRKISVSRRTKHCGHIDQVDSETDTAIKHKRRYFCETQAVTVETVFRKEIQQGKVTERVILSRFHENAELREVFDVQPKEVSKILIKKIADRVRCFIRKQRDKSEC